MAALTVSTKWWHYCMSGSICDWMESTEGTEEPKIKEAPVKSSPKNNSGAKKLPKRLKMPLGKSRSDLGLPKKKQSLKDAPRRASTSSLSTAASTTPPASSNIVTPPSRGQSVLRKLNWASSKRPKKKRVVETTKYSRMLDSIVEECGAVPETRPRTITPPNDVGWGKLTVLLPLDASLMDEFETRIAFYTEGELLEQSRRMFTLLTYALDARDAVATQIILGRLSPQSRVKLVAMQVNAQNKTIDSVAHDDPELRPFLRVMVAMLDQRLLDNARLAHWKANKGSFPRRPDGRDARHDKQ